MSSLDNFARDWQESSRRESKEFHELLLCKRAAGFADIAEIEDFLSWRHLG
jgi:hypothetical protein